MNVNTSDMTPFMTASRQGLRFHANRGMLSVEDLWQLDLKDLDALAVKVSENIKPEARKSFLDEQDERKTRAAKDDELRFQILMIVMRIRQDEAKAKKAEAEHRAHGEFLEGLLKQARLKKLENMSEEDILKQIKMHRGEVVEDPQPAAAGA